MRMGIGMGLGPIGRPKKKLSTQQRREIVKLGSQLPGFSCQGSTGSFLDRWLVCEMLAKKLIMYHKKLGELPTNYWTYEQVGAATKYFGLKIEANLNKSIFKGGHGKRGKNTPRQLRNGYLHSLSSADNQEILQRISELKKLLDKWRKKVIEI